MIQKTIYNTILCILLISVFSGCSKQNEVREYGEVVATSDECGKCEAHSAVKPEPPKSITWNTPSSWNEQPVSGMRLASFGIEEGVICTMIILQGEAGGIQANVQRWAQQLDISMDTAECDSFIEKQESMKVSDLTFKIVDYTSIIEKDDSDAMIVGLGDIGGRTVFIKMMGEKQKILPHKKSYIELLNSIKKSN